MYTRDRNSLVGPDSEPKGRIALSPCFGRLLWSSKRQVASSANSVRRPGRPFRFFDNRQKYLLFVTTTTEKREVLVATLRRELGDEAQGYDIFWQPEERYRFRYGLNALPGEMDDAIGTSTLLVAWNAAV